MSTYVIGDIHGEYLQLKQLLKKMNVQEDDELYIIGDVVDRGPNPIKALQYLMTLPNCTCIAGNHELMALSNLKLLLSEVTDEFLNGLSMEIMGKLTDWMLNGGSSTISEFTKLSADERRDILDFMRDFEICMELDINGQEYLLVHAGLGNFSKDKYIDDYSVDELVWDRMDYDKVYYEDIIVVTGHTPTQLISGNKKPGFIYKANNHIAIDCMPYSETGRLAGICLETGEEYYSR